MTPARLLVEMIFDDENGGKIYWFSSAHYITRIGDAGKRVWDEVGPGSPWSLPTILRITVLEELDE